MIRAYRIASTLSDSVHHQLNMCAIAAVVSVMSLLALAQRSEGDSAEKLLADLIDHREVESYQVHATQHCCWRVSRAGDRGKAYFC